jgi:hypothetical protein
MPLIDDARLYGLPIEILIADSDQLSELGALCAASNAVFRRQFFRAHARRTALYGALGAAFIFLLASALHAIRSLFPDLSPWAALVPAVSVYCLLYWLFNTHDRLNAFARILDDDVGAARSRYDAITRSADQIARKRGLGSGSSRVNSREDR